MSGARPDFQQLVDAHYQSLYRFALSLARDEIDAWSRDGMTYFLFVPKGRDPVKEFLSRLGYLRYGKIASSNRRSTAWPWVKIFSGVPRIVAPSWT